MTTKFIAMNSAHGLVDSLRHVTVRFCTYSYVHIYLSVIRTAFNTTPCRLAIDWSEALTVRTGTCTRRKKSEHTFSTL